MEWKKDIKSPGLKRGIKSPGLVEGKSPGLKKGVKSSGLIEGKSPGLKEWKVASQDTGKRLSAFLQEKLQDEFSQRQIKRWLESNFCTVNGQVERFASRKVEAGDKVKFKIKEAPKTQLNTLWEDDYYTIIDKPAGLQTEDINAILVHRLDRDTSGVLILAKTNEAREAMEKLFKERHVQKHYLALVDGFPKQLEGTITAKIGIKRQQSGVKQWGIMPTGKSAETDWKLERKLPGYSLLSCYPKTGRTHQIRLHLAHIGHPILGDYTYCRTFKCPLRPQRQMLHAHSVSFIHPFTHQQVTVDAPIPPDFAEYLEVAS